MFIVVILLLINFHKLMRLVVTIKLELLVLGSPDALSTPIIIIY